jgi:tetratricopeptide (TPR) repeat protein
MKLTRAQRALFFLAVLVLLAASIPSRTDLAWHYVAQRQYAEALRTLEPLPRPGKDREGWEAIAEAWAGLGQPEREMVAREYAAAAGFGDHDTLRRLADAYEAVKDVDAVARTLERIVAEYPDDDGTLQRLLGLYDWLGRYPDTSRVLTRLLALGIHRADLAEDVMTLARTLNRTPDVVAALEAYAARRPEDARAQRQLAELYDTLGRDADARGRWQVVARDRLATPPAVPETAAVPSWERPAAPPFSRRAAGPEDPVAVAEAFARRVPEDPRGLRAVVGALVAADRARDALPWQERLVAVTPDDEAAWRQLIQLYEWAAQPAGALGALERLARRRPDDRQLIRELVDALVAHERVADAAVWQRRLVEREPGAVAPALRLAQLYEWMSQEREAIGVYEGLDRVGTLPPTALARLGDLYRFQDRPADFLRVAERRLAATPGDDALRALVIDAAEGLDRPADAARLLRPLVDANPRDLARAARYVALAVRGNRMSDALAVHRRAAPGAGVDYRMKVAQAFGDAGRVAEAAAEYEAVLAAIPSDPAVLREVGRRALAISRNDVSLKAWRGVLARSSDDPEALKRSGQILAWTNDARGARAAFERFNHVKGGDYEVHFLLGELYTAARDEARAREQYERALRLLPPRSSQR